MTRLTHRERAALMFIRRYSDQHGYPPSRREIMTALDYRSPSAAAHLVSRLRDKGLVSVTPGVSRGLALREGAAS